MKRLAVWVAVVLAAGLLFPSAALADCDSTYNTNVQMQGGGDTLVVCYPGGGFDFRGNPSKADVTADSANPTDSATVTIQLKEDDGDNLSFGTFVDVIIADTDVAGGGLASTAPDTGVSNSSSESGNILNERVADKLLTAQTNGSGEVQLLLEHNADNDFYVRVKLPTGRTVTSSKIDFD